MDPIDHQLHRLLKAAAAATPRNEPREAPFGFATRVLASLRENVQADDAAAALFVIRHAIAWASAIMVVSVVCNFQAISDSLTAKAVNVEQDELNVTDSAVRLALAE